MHRLIACRYPSADVAVLSWERLSGHFAGERMAGIATMLRRQAEHGARVEPAAQVTRDRYIGVQPQTHGLFDRELVKWVHGVLDASGFDARLGFVDSRLDGEVDHPERSTLVPTSEVTPL